MRSLSTRQRAFATIGVMLALFLASLDQSIVSPALPRIAADLHGISLYAWVATSYLVASAVFVPIAGKLGDMFGRKPFILAGIVGFVSGSALCGLSQNMGELIAFRGFQGIFGGLLMASAFTVLADIYTVEQRTRMQGLFGGVFGLSTMIGPTLGGNIVDHWGWRWIFYVNVPVGVVAVLVTLAALPYVRSSANWRDIDFLGVITLAGGLVPVLLGLSITTSHAWTSAPVLLLLIGGGIVLGLFVIIETRYARNPVVPFGLFRSNQFSVMVGVAFFSGIGMFGA
ncbi:MAG TPA: MFS transporter, partial [Candidatus Dormibacteraeota bacterium]|nr:MFS transporter [Candidatus Dormibacteraeota bacterium]